jgi:hypothetical protein
MSAQSAICTAMSILILYIGSYKKNILKVIICQFCEDILKN